MNASANSGADEPDEASRAAETCISVLHREMSLQLQRIAWLILRDHQLAADAVQEAFLLLVERWSELESESRRGWLVKTVQFKALNLRTKQRQSGQLPNRLLGLGLMRSVGSERPYDSLRSDATTGSGSAEQQQALRDAIRALPIQQQLVIRLRLTQELTFAEIATELNVPLGTVLSRMRLALKKLREKLNDGDAQDSN